MVKRLVVSHAFHSPRMDGMLEEFATIAGGLSFSEPTIPLVSNLTGELASADELCSADYWVRHARQTVRFADGVRWLADHGVRGFLELGPEGVLSAMVADCLENGDREEGGAALEEPLVDGVGPGAGVDALAVPVLRSDRAEDRTFLGALAQLWVEGTDVDWASMFEGTGARRVGLPAYAFQRQRYWLQTPTTTGNPTTIGQTPTQHPMLLSAVALADGGGRLLTGQISLQSQPWLADHVVGGRVLLPGTAFLELALRAAGEVECNRIEELVQEAPLLLPAQGAVRLQVSVGEPEDSGRRSIAIYSNPDRTPDGTEEVWTRHVEGVLAPGEAVHSQQLEEWPPAGAIPVKIAGLYEALAELGLEYGPAFQGLHAVWRRGEDVFAEVSLPVRSGRARITTSWCTRPYSTQRCTPWERRRSAMAMA